MSTRASENIVRKVSKYLSKEFSVIDSSAWRDISLLSTNSVIDDISVDENDIVVRGDLFEGVASLYVTLNFGRGDDGFAEGESFSADFSGHIDDENVIIDDFRVDTSRRFE